jgi:hypothetical protein
MEREAMNKSAQRRWSSGTYVDPVPDGPTEFDLRVKRLGLANSPEKWPTSPALRKFVKSNKNRIYVPEWLLQEMNMAGFYEGD